MSKPRIPKLPSPHLALDTSTYSHLRRRHSVVLEWLATADLVEISVTVLGELEGGFRLGTRYQENAATLADFLAEPFMRVQTITPGVSRCYGQLFAELRRSGTPIPVNDIWIAAGAIDSRAHLVTFDRHFANVQGLDCTILESEE